jgi:hypothetical protein
MVKYELVFIRLVVGDDDVRLWLQAGQKIMALRENSPFCIFELGNIENEILVVKFPDPKQDAIENRFVRDHGHDLPAECDQWRGNLLRFPRPEVDSLMVMVRQTAQTSNARLGNPGRVLFQLPELRALCADL